MKNILLFSLILIGVQIKAQISINGTATPAGAYGTDFFLSETTPGSGIWYGTFTLSIGELKIRKNGSWSPVHWTAATAIPVFPIGTAEVNSVGIQITSPGVYDVTFNEVNSFTSFVKNLSIIGPATPHNNWDTDYYLTKSSDPYIYTADVDLSTNLLKFRLNENWTFNWGSSSFPTGIGALAGANIPVSPTALYTVSFNIASKSYSFTAGGIGNVGIGIASPIEKLDVYGNIKTTGEIKPNGTAGAVNQVLTSNGDGTMQWALASGTGWSLNGNSGTNPSSNFIGTTDATTLIFKGNNIERLRMEDDTIKTFGFNHFNGKSLIKYNHNTQLIYDPGFIIRNNNEVSPYCGMRFERLGSQKSWEFNSNLSSSGSFNDFVFKYNDDINDTIPLTLKRWGGIAINGGSTSPNRYALDIKNINSQNFGLRITNHNNTNNWEITTTTLSGELRLYSQGIQIGNFQPVSGVYTAISDLKYKENIMNLGSSLDKILLLQPRTFQFKKDKIKRNQIGFIAQELKDVFPEFVHISNDDRGEGEIHTVDYSSISVVAIKAIQEQQAQIEALKSENASLVKQLNDVLARLSKLEEK